MTIAIYQYVMLGTSSAGCATSSSPGTRHRTGKKVRVVRHRQVSLASLKEGEAQFERGRASLGARLSPLVWRNVVEEMKIRYVTNSHLVTPESSCPYDNCRPQGQSVENVARIDRE